MPRISLELARGGAGRLANSRARRGQSLGVERARVVGVARVLQVELAEAGVGAGRGGRRGSACTQSNMSMPRADRLDDVVRRADAHEVARLVRRQARRDRLEHGQHHVLRLADGEAADGVAVEADARRAPARCSAPQPRDRRRPARCRTAPCPGCSPKATLRALGPAQATAHRPLDRRVRGRQRRRIRRAASGCRSRAAPGSRSSAPASADASSRRYASWKVTPSRRSCAAAPAT